MGEVGQYDIQSNACIGVFRHEWREHAMDGAMAVIVIGFSYDCGGIADMLAKAEIHLQLFHDPSVMQFGQT